MVIFIAPPVLEVPVKLIQLTGGSWPLRDGDTESWHPTHSCPDGSSAAVQVHDTDEEGGGDDDDVLHVDADVLGGDGDKSCAHWSTMYEVT